MKNSFPQAILCAGALLLLLSANPLAAQRVEATRTVTTSEGTISEFGPQGITIKSEEGTVPVRYISSDTTNYVDENDNPVDVALVKSGLPATIHYTKVGDTLIASKVVVKTHGKSHGAVVVVKPATQVVTTPVTEVVTTPVTAGVITEFGPENLLIKTEGSPDPLRYTSSKTTTYVDEAGAPVSIETVRSGVPVTVHYTKVGGHHVASKVIVHKSVAVPAEVIEKTTKTTTTTTTTTTR